MNLSDLPSNLLVQIAIHLDNSSLVQICAQNKDLNERLCSNEDFWQQKYLHDCGIPEKIPLVWREAFYRKWNKGEQLFTFNPELFNPTLIPHFCDIQALSTGGNHTLILKENGRVYSFGENIFGQLGLGDNQSQDKEPILILLDQKIQKISAGGNFSLLLDDQGQVWSFGANIFGQLGLGDHRGRNKPTRIQLPENIKIKDISAGENHSLILDEQGQVWSCGHGDKLGLGDYHSRNIPTLVQNIPKIKQISAGIYHSLFLSEREYNQVWGFGSNYVGEAGLSQTGMRNAPGLIPFFQENSDIRVKEIIAGCKSSFILIEGEDEHGYAFGDNSYGKLGIGEDSGKHTPTLMDIDNIRSIYAGVHTNMILTQNNEIYLLSKFRQEKLENYPCPEKFSANGYISNVSVGVHGFIFVRPYTLFFTIQTLLEKNFIRDRKILFSNYDHTLMEYTDIQGNIHRIKVKYDKKTDQIFPLP